MPVIIALEKLHKIPVKPWTGPILTQGATSGILSPIGRPRTSRPLEIMPPEVVYLSQEKTHARTVLT
jgi:hypothetical protein